jgi:phage terminase large subunit-like protein
MRRREFIAGLGGVVAGRDWSPALAARAGSFPTTPNCSFPGHARLADRIACETNQGGDLVINTLQQVDPMCRLPKYLRRRVNFCVRSLSAPYMNKIAFRTSGGSRIANDKLHCGL